MINLAIFLALLTLGIVFGKLNEKRHYRSIHAREKAASAIPTTTFKTLPKEMISKHCELASGSVVISIDYFKRFLSGFRLTFGGEMNSYSSLIDRARREAVLRMQESHPGASFFLNVRIETSSIGNGSDKGVGSIEVLAYGTAIYSA